MECQNLNPTERGSILENHSSTPCSGGNVVAKSRREGCYPLSTSAPGKGGSCGLRRWKNPRPFALNSTGEPAVFPASLLAFALYPLCAQAGAQAGAQACTDTNNQGYDTSTHRLLGVFVSQEWNCWVKGHMYF